MLRGKGHTEIPYVKASWSEKALCILRHTGKIWETLGGEMRGWMRCFKTLETRKEFSKMNKGKRNTQRELSKKLACTI